MTTERKKCFLVTSPLENFQVKPCPILFVMSVNMRQLEQEVQCPRPSKLQITIVSVILEVETLQLLSILSFLLCS